MTNSGRRSSALMPRRFSTRKKKRIIVVICEGEKTEYIYFSDLRDRLGRDCPITIKPIRRTGVRPVRLVEFARKQLGELSIDFSNGDRLWCVFDVDYNTHEEIGRAISLAGDKIRIAMSNPCFELWYLLHYEYTHAHMNPDEAIRRLRGHMRHYEKNRSITEIVIDKLTVAVRNAVNLKEYHAGNGTDTFSCDANPYTHVHELVGGFAEILQCLLSP